MRRNSSRLLIEPHSPLRRFSTSTRALVAVCLLAACRSPSPSAATSDASASKALGSPAPVSALDSGTWIDCVGVLHVVNVRGHHVANVQRFGQSNPSLRTSDRIIDLGPSDLRAFCDWEACIRTNGYAHTCWVNDAGWERCRVCDGGTDCDGLPMSQDDCAAHATDPGRAQCHVGLLQECLIQQGLRGPADSRVTESCRLSAQACAGQLPGDLSVQALAAQHETDQVTIEACYTELDLASALQPDSSFIAQARAALMADWDGGLPADDIDAGSADGAPDSE